MAGGGTLRAVAATIGAIEGRGAQSPNMEGGGAASAEGHPRSCRPPGLGIVIYSNGGVRNYSASLRRQKITPRMLRITPPAVCGPCGLGQHWRWDGGGLGWGGGAGELGRVGAGWLGLGGSGGGARELGGIAHIGLQTAGCLPGVLRRPRGSSYVRLRPIMTHYDALRPPQIL